jgi:glutathione synthase/RimK-type ligase-like ATP-grasp enzyme
MPTDTLMGRALRLWARLQKLERWRHRPRRLLAKARRFAFYRASWEQAATSVGASITYLDDPLAEIRCGDSVLRVRGNVTSLDDPVTLSVAGNKPLVLRLLDEHDIPAPRHCCCRYDDLTNALRFTSGFGRACVVKPARSTGGGAGITTGVRGRVGLAAAMARAGGYCNDLVIEEHVDGGNFRLLYLDGELLDAVERRPPSVRGDGKSTLRRLIEAENADRENRGIEVCQSFLNIDRELRQTLHAAGRDLSYVPQSGERVRLKHVVSENRRDDNVGATGRVCASLAESGAQAAAAVGARLAGVDVITADPSVSLAESGGVIVEVNTTPGFYYHYMTAGEPVPVALLILQRLCEPAP